MSMSGDDGVCCVCEQWFGDCTCGVSLVRLHDAVDAVDAEEEFDGEIPDEVFAYAASSPEHMEEAIRHACVLTKRGIRERMLGLTVAVSSEVDCDE